MKLLGAQLRIGWFAKLRQAELNYCEPAVWRHAMAVVKVSMVLNFASNWKLGTCKAKGT